MRRRGAETGKLAGLGRKVHWRGVWAFLFNACMVAVGWQVSALASVCYTLCHEGSSANTEACAFMTFDFGSVMHEEWVYVNYHENNPERATMSAN